VGEESDKVSESILVRVTVQVHIQPSEAWTYSRGESWQKLSAALNSQTILLTGRRYIVSLVNTSPLLTRDHLGLDGHGWPSPEAKFCWVTSHFFMRTISLTCKFGLASFQGVWALRDFRYEVLHSLHIYWDSCQMSFNLRWRLIVMPGSVGQGLQWLSYQEVSWYKYAVPILGGLSVAIIRQLLSVASTSVNKVFNSSKVRRCGGRTFFKMDFMARTPYFHNPPMWGARAAEKCHSTLYKLCRREVTSWKSAVFLVFGIWYCQLWSWRSNSCARWYNSCGDSSV